MESTFDPPDPEADKAAPRLFHKAGERSEVSEEVRQKGCRKFLGHASWLRCVSSFPLDPLHLRKSDADSVFPEPTIPVSACKFIAQLMTAAIPKAACSYMEAQKHLRAHTGASHSIVCRVLGIVLPSSTMLEGGI